MIVIEVFSILEAYNKIRPLTETTIYSRLQGYINVSLDYKGRIIRDTSTNSVMYNRFGKVFDSGECLLFPDDKCSDWNDFIKDQIRKEHEKELKQGCVCLVKKQPSDPWVLAIYHQKLDNNYYQAKVGKEFEMFQHCIAFESNKEYLGRESFPSWFIGDEVD